MTQEVLEEEDKANSLVLDLAGLEELKRGIKKLNANIVLAESKKVHEIAKLESEVQRALAVIPTVEKLHDLVDTINVTTSGLNGQFGQLNIRMVALEVLMEKVEARFTYTKIIAFLITVVTAAITAIGIVYKYVGVIKIPAS